MSARWQVRVCAGYDLRPQDEFDLTVLARLLDRWS
jgi:hypothetical protein